MEFSEFFSGYECGFLKISSKIWSFIFEAYIQGSDHDLKKLLRFNERFDRGISEDFYFRFFAGDSFAFFLIAFFKDFQDP